MATDQDRKVKAPVPVEVWELTRTNRERTRQETAAKAAGPAVEVEVKVVVEWAAWGNAKEVVVGRIDSETNGTRQRLLDAAGEVFADWGYGKPAHDTPPIRDAT